MPKMNNNLRLLRMHLRAADRALKDLSEEDGYMSHTLSEVRISLNRALEWTDEHTWEQSLTEEEVEDEDDNALIEVMGLGPDDLEAKYHRQFE